MIHSMTAFASGTGARDGLSWTWDLRSVNARGLDLRIRVPDWIDGLEPGLRALLQKGLSRGSVTLGLRLIRDTGPEDGPDADAIDLTLARIAAVQGRAAAQGMSLAPCSAADVLELSAGQGPRQSSPDEVASLRAALLAEFEATILPAFLAMRATEGAALKTVLLDQVAQVAALTDTAAAQAEARLPQVRETLKAALARVVDNTDGADPDRVAQELALLAVKADVTEEIDRLRTHVAAARDHLAGDGPTGRKLDFLTQEFNREANTLCAKAQDAALTATGLQLKAVIDQMREQVQNVE
ncbi:YicC family protein [Maribius pontilimi]|uniref:YicC family protein n=1 Tax=Palleronia pontilimi TaxID=1964209 RepID=A0A934IHG7_9RHOB|nr:YicC/YloC family endoribonuclease [Palleronia pontilimi]MBJ3762941.1 YicC family protein [Palleronia pontilimi]